MSQNVAAIICAAGASSRFGGKRNKALVDVAGRAVFFRSVELFSNRDDVKQVLLGIASEDEELVSVKWGPNLKFFGVSIFMGGDERFDTVNIGIELIKRYLPVRLRQRLNRRRIILLRKPSTEPVSTKLRRRRYSPLPCLKRHTKTSKTSIKVKSAMIRN
ncbi:2-C-methyl-D-erythritol 4-phosphate cytidylyltransferase [subsurface metagenome]